MLGFLLIIQARLGSSRLPGKVLLNSNDNIPIIKSQIKRLRLIFKILKIKYKIIVAAPEKDKKVFDTYFKKNIFYGPEKNVLKRFFFCAKKYKAKKIIRITSDDPLITIDSFKIIFKSLSEKKNLKNRLISLWHTKKVPDGSNISYLDYTTLEKIYKLENSSITKEHIILIKKSLSKINLIIPKIPKYISESGIRSCIDTYKDYKLYRKSKIKYNEAINFKEVSKVFKKKF